MLVLTRRIGEQIVLPGIGAVVTVLRSRTGVARLGISAPAEIIVLRQELSREHLLAADNQRKAKIPKSGASPDAQ